MSEHVAFQVHEHEGYLIYANNGLSPYHAWTEVLRDGYGWREDDIIIDAFGVTWSVDVKFNGNTGLIPRDGDAADERMNEYWINAKAVDADDQRKASFGISPRWKGQLSGDDATELSTPFQHDTATIDGEEVDMPDEGVNVEYHTSNLDSATAPSELLPALLQGLAENAGEYWDYDYYRYPHRTSNVKTVEGYVRHHDDTQDQLVQSDGVLMRIMHLLGSREGSQIEYKADNKEILGHNHRVMLDDDDIGDLIPGQQYGKMLKSYHPRHNIDTGPLAHPKFDVNVMSDFQSDTLYYHNLDDVWQEIEEAAVNVLSWAGIQTGTNGPWIEDDHFTPQASDVEIQRYENPLPAIEASQDAQVLRLFTETTDADQNMIRELAVDGGEAHHAALEEASGHSSSTLWRMLQRVPELVESDNGLISFTSEKLYQDVRDILDRADKQIQRASNAVGELLGVDADVLESSKNAMRRFVQKYAADVDHDAGTLEVKLNAVVTELKSIDSYPKIWIVVDELRRALRGSRYSRDLDFVNVTYERTTGEVVTRNINSPSLARP